MRMHVVAEESMSPGELSSAISVVNLWAVAQVVARGGERGSIWRSARDQERSRSRRRDLRSIREKALPVMPVGVVVRVSPGLDRLNGQ